MSSAQITEWHAKRAQAEISGWVLNGMNTACAFVARQAEGMVPVRTGITKRDITFDVQVDGNDIEGVVGVKKGKAFYAKFIEFGTSKMAAQPFIRPALLNNKREVVKLIMSGGQ